MKAPFIKWLYSNSGKYSDIKNKNLIDILFLQLKDFIYNNDLELNISDEDLLIHFYIFNYDRKITNTNNEYFDFKYHEDIVDMFISFKELCKSQGSLLFNEKKDTADNLLNFINKYIITEYDYDYILEETEDFIVDDEY